MSEKLSDIEKLQSRNPSFPVEHTIEPEYTIIDHAAEKKLVRKLDIFIIPITMLLYLFSFLDR
jgi:hypothetical protein